MAVLRSFQAYLTPVPSSPHPVPLDVGDPVGGDLVLEQLTFHTIDLVSFLWTHVRSLTLGEITGSLPGWSMERWSRTRTSLQAHWGITLSPDSSPSAATTIRVSRRPIGAWLAYALGRRQHGGIRIPDPLQLALRSACQASHRASGFLRTLALTRRDTPLSAADLPAGAPLSPWEFTHVLDRWTRRQDLKAHHHQAIQLAAEGDRLRVSAPWPYAPPRGHRGRGASPRIVGTAA